MLAFRRLQPPFRFATNHRYRRLQLNVSRRFAATSTTNPANYVELRCNSPYEIVQAISSAAESSSLSTGITLHSAAFKLGLIASNVFVAAALLNLYTKCDRLFDVRILFDEILEPNVVAWNTLIYSYSQSMTPALAIESLMRMLSRGTRPTPSTVSSVMVGCSRLENLSMGTMLHCFCLKLGFCSNVAAATTLLDAYSKCRNVVAARKVFDEMVERNAITWTSLLTGYALDQKPTDAMKLVKEMSRQGLVATKVTYNSLLSSFSRSEDLPNARQIHGLVLKEGLENDSYIAVTLISMYSRCGSLEDLLKSSITVPYKDQTTLCNSVISGLLHFGDSKEVLQRFLEMRRICVDIDIFTFVTLLKAIGILSALEEGRQIHALIVKTGHGSIVSVMNALVAMYAKCGEIDDSKLVFSSMEAQKDLISWNSILAGCARHGNGREAVQLFQDMGRVGLEPNRSSFLSVLTACSHAGLVDEGIEIFYSMMNGRQQAPVVAQMEHYACLVDILGRAGYLEKAEAFVNNMPMKPDVSVYRTLLNACQLHQNVEIAHRTATSLLEVCPYDPSTHVLLANAFAADGCWDFAAKLRKKMRRKGVRKKPSCSWIQDVLVA